MKIKLLFCFYILVLAIIIGKLFYLQILNSHAYSSDYLTTRRITPDRGLIMDRKEQPLAINAPSYLLYVEPQKVTNRQYLITRLDSVLKMGEATLSARIDDKKEWVRIRDGLDTNTKKQITDLNLKGVGFQDGVKRYYPEASLSAHIIGFVGKDSQGENLGYVGVEGFYDQELAGLAGLIKSERDLIDRPIFFGTQERIESENGRNLILTVDNAVQNIIKKRLVDGMEKYQAKQGCVIVANPTTMEILGMTCLPDFDPGKYYDYPSNNYKDIAISDLYEPGSTFKPLVVAAAVEEKAIKPDEIINEDGPALVSGYQIKTWNDKYEGKITITRILEKSSNVGMVYIGDKLGNDKLFNYIHNFGFGNPTNIDLQGETGGYIKPEKQWYPIDFATATFGQGLAVTPMQMITAFASVINGGTLLRPYVVEKTSLDGDEKAREPKVVRRMVSKRTSDILVKMLISTVEHGDASWALPKGYRIGGKTGTAQVAISGNYDPSKTIASFIGFAPAYNPKFIALVILKEPKTSEWGSETAAPIFFDITKDLLVYYNIPPE